MRRLVTMLLIDKRIVRRSLDRGKVDEAEYKTLLEQLPDLTDRMMRLGDEASDEGDGPSV